MNTAAADKQDIGRKFESKQLESSHSEDSYEFNSATINQKGPLGEIYQGPSAQENGDVLQEEDDDNFPSLSRLTDLASHIGAISMATLPEKSRILSQH